MSLAAKLDPLEEMTVKSQKYDAIRRAMNFSARLPEEELCRMV